MSSWRFAGRLAWREVRRRPGRTALVALLVAVPVLAMTFVSVLARFFVEEDAFVVERPAGVDMELSLVEAEAVAPVLPDGAEAWSFATVSAPVRDIGGTTTEGVDIHELPDGRPRARILRPEGDLPGPGEVWLSRNLLDELGVSVGDRLELRYPAGSWRVVGTGDLPHDVRGMFVSELDDAAFVDGVQVGTLVDLPGDPSEEEVAAVFATASASLAAGGSHRGLSESSGGGDLVLLWTWVAGAVGLGVLGIVIAAAFATSARRQLVTVGLLASNGAPEPAIRRALTLQGTWSGLVGSVAGVVGGWLALRVAQPWLEELSRPLEMSWSVRPVDVAVVIATGTLAATLAARVPARGAARVPVMAALAGRRPLGTVPPRLLRIGLGAFAVGVALLAAATVSGGGSGPALTAVIGALVLLAGICCCTPLVTDVASRASARVGRSWRLAGRSLGRTRARTAGVVTAIAVTAAGALAGAVGMAHLARPASDDDTVPLDVVELVAAAAIRQVPGAESEPTPQVARAVDDDLRERVEAVAPGATWLPRRVVALDLVGSGAGADQSSLVFDDLLVATPELLDALRVSDENRARLDETGVLSIWSYQSPGTLEVASGGRRATLDVVPAALEPDDPLLGSRGWYSSAFSQGRSAAFLITPEVVAANELETLDAGAVARFPEPLSSAVHEDIVDVVLGADALLSMWYVDAPTGDAAWMVSAAPPDDGMPPVGSIHAAIVGAALLLVLAVVAIGLSLAATESRDERDVLVAVGARPRTLRTMAGAKAVVMTLAGVAVAVPGGLVPAFAVSRAAGTTFTVPWLVLGGLLFAVPVAAGLAASGVSGLAQRLRPVRMSTLAVD